jgi:hypothetical protein
MRNITDIINEWYETIYDSDAESFLDFAQGLNINEFTTENGIKTIWLENGMYYIAHGYAIRETDGEKAREIIAELEEYGIEFEGVRV